MTRNILTQIISTVLLLVVLATSTQSQTFPKCEMRAFWIATVENI